MSLTEMPHKIVFLLPFLILALLSPLACADPDRPHHDHSKHASPAGDKPSSSKPKALGLRAVVKDTLHRPDVHAAKSVMVMADVALVIAGIQLQLSMVHEKMMEHKLGASSTAAKHHHHLAHVHHHTEHLCAQGSTSILAVLLVHSLAEMWAMGVEKFMAKTALVVDLFVVATSLYLELLFDSLDGVSRLYAELWRFVRIVHGSYETFVHSPLVAPHVAADHGHDDHHH